MRRFVQIYMKDIILLCLMQSELRLCLCWAGHVQVFCEAIVVVVFI